MAHRKLNEQHPLTGFRFEVEIKGVVEAAFSSVVGLTIETDVVPMQEGGLNTYMHQLKGQTKYTNIILKRGVTTSDQFYKWITKSVNTGSANCKRENGIITILDDAGKPKVSWKFVRAWPCKFEGPSFDASSSAALIETLELAHEGLELL